MWFSNVYHEEKFLQKDHLIFIATKKLYFAFQQTKTTSILLKKNQNIPQEIPSPSFLHFITMKYCDIKNTFPWFVNSKKLVITILILEKCLASQNSNGHNKAHLFLKKIHSIGTTVYELYNIVGR